GVGSSGERRRNSDGAAGEKRGDRWRSHGLSSRGGDAERQAPEPPDDEAVLADGRFVWIQLEVGGSLQDLAEDDGSLKACEGRADAEVDASSEPEVVSWRRAVEDDLGAPFFLVRVAVGSTPEQQDGSAGGYRDAPEAGGGWGVAEVVPERGLEAEHFLDERREGGGVLTEVGLEVGVGGEVV